MAKVWSAFGVSVGLLQLHDRACFFSIALLSNERISTNIIVPDGALPSCRGCISCYTYRKTMRKQWIYPTFQTVRCSPFPMKASVSLEETFSLCWVSEDTFPHSSMIAWMALYSIFRHIPYLNPARIIENTHCTVKIWVPIIISRSVPTEQRIMPVNMIGNCAKVLAASLGIKMTILIHNVQFLLQVRQQKQWRQPEGLQAKKNQRHFAAQICLGLLGSNQKKSIVSARSIGVVGLSQHSMTLDHLQCYSTWRWRKRAKIPISTVHFLKIRSGIVAFSTNRHCNMPKAMIKALNSVNKS